MSGQLSTRLFIIRHAETDKNKCKQEHNRAKHNVYITDENKNEIDLSLSLFFEKNCKLNHNGKIQAEILADYFNSIQHKICAVYSSPLIRAIETADIIFKKIVEKEYVDFIAEDRLFSGCKNKFTNKQSLIEEVKQLIQELVETYEGYDVILITHNHIFNIIHKLYSLELHVLQDKVKVDNCSMSCLEFTNGKCNILYWSKKVKMTYVLV